MILMVLLCPARSDAAEKTAQIVTRGFVKVHKGPSASATVIAFAKFGEYYPVLWESSTWIKIEYIEVEGWIEKKHVKVISGLGKPITETPTPKVEEPAKPPEPKKEPLKPKERVTQQEKKRPKRSGPSIYDSPTELRESDRKTAKGESKKDEKKKPESRRWEPERKEKIPQKKIAKKDTVRQVKEEVMKEVPQEEVKAGPVIMAETLYVQAIIPQLQVFSNPDTTSPVLGIAPKDKYFLLLRKYESWLKISFADSTGWVDASCVRIVKKQEKPLLTGLKNAVIVLGVIVAIILIMGMVLLYLRQKLTRRVSVKKSVLIIALERKQITYSLTNTPATLKECFAEIAFTTNRVDNLKVAENRIFYHAPDVLMVDWRFSPTIEQDIFAMLNSKTSISNIPVIFYNVPDSVRMVKTRQFSNVYYLDISFTDQELFKLITPQIAAGNKPQIIRKSVQESAMEGEIQGEGLNAVLQFVEIGKKTGCLLVDDEKPFGLIYFEKGVITYAASENHKAKEAVREILAMKKGYFRFAAGKRSMESNCNLAVMPVLMEFAQIDDEVTRYHDPGVIPDD